VHVREAGSGRARDAQGGSDDLLRQVRTAAGIAAPPGGL